MVERAPSPHVAQLLRRALQRADSVFAQSAGAHALTRSQFAVLNAVKQSGGGGTQSALVEVTGIDRSSIADLVGRLVKRGCLQRRPAEHDKRAYSVQLTAKGAAVLAAAEPTARQAANLLLAPLSQTERLRFVRALEKIVARE
jgi:MarR family transcriptional regulator, temperature-dependent positive regulator of motility